MASVVKLLLLDRARDGPADRAPFEHLKVGDLIGADDPVAPPGQSLGVPVAPEDLLSAGLEPGVAAGRPPVAGAVRLQIHPVEDPADGPGADRLDNSVGDGLPGQILTRPVGDVQAPGDRLQAGECDDLGPLEGGKSGPGGPVAEAVREGPIPPCRRSVGTCDARCRRRTPTAKRGARSAPLRRSPGPCGRGGPGTRGGSRSERPLGGLYGHESQSRVGKVSDRAWGDLLNWNHSGSTAKRVPGISGTASGQGH